MTKKYWADRWQRNEINFHQLKVNSLLERHWSPLKIVNTSHVFVPLCGKSLDMLWLANSGCHVTGVELSEIACESFFIENELTYNKAINGDFVKYYNHQIELYCGDFFTLSSDILPPINIVYDRASLIALPPELRQQYANHLTQLMGPHCQMLLIVFDFPRLMIQGPPYSVSFQEIMELFGEQFHIDELERMQISKYKETYEVVYSLRR